MCIRDRYQRRVHGDSLVCQTIKRYMRHSILVAFCLSLILAAVVAEGRRKHNRGDSKSGNPVANAVQAAKVCKKVSEQCLKFALIKNPKNEVEVKAKTDIGKFCLSITTDKTCVEEVTKNPGCYEVCVDGCGKIKDENAESGKKWNACIAACVC
eukprot:TRINITY_DN19626_c0_g1_i1.p1 TRINITY_DN19626_c0_g1~~TRINITY_DN19626_c0_g1_i1.p1  ORF type:complete len:154 (+),score=40.85 TRINITY_DN19626_c0_g1_i1:65-526(+)